MHISVGKLFTSRPAIMECGNQKIFQSDLKSLITVITLLPVLSSSGGRRRLILIYSIKLLKHSLLVTETRFEVAEKGGDREEEEVERRDGFRNI